MKDEWIDDIDTLCGYRSLTHGDRPDVIASSSQREDIKHIRAILTQLADDSIEPRQVCIAARTNDDVEAIVDGLKKAGVPTLGLERSTPDDPTIPCARVAKYRIKELEFGVVIIAAARGWDAGQAASVRPDRAKCIELQQVSAPDGAAMYTDDHGRRGEAPCSVGRNDCDDR